MYAKPNRFAASTMASRTSNARRELVARDLDAGERAIAGSAAERVPANAHLTKTQVP